jgi:hypothetical protein
MDRIGISLERFAARALAGLVALVAGSAAGLEATTHMEAGTVRGAPGSTRTLSVTLRTDQTILGIQNDVEIPAAATVPTRSDGKPDCRLGDEVPGLVVLSAAFPSDVCDGSADCRVIRFLIIEVDSFDAIPDGTVLYTCPLTIAADAAAGSYPLIVSRTGASDRNGNAVAATGIDGAVIVELPTPTPTATPVTVEPPTATPTATATLTATRTGTPSASDNGGCNVAESRNGSAWILLLPLLALRRRRAR